MGSEIIKECPFCGGETDIVYGHTDIVACNNRDCLIFGIYIDLKSWNTRPLEQKQADRIKHLESKIDMLNRTVETYKLSNKILNDGKEKLKAENDMLVDKIKSKDSEIKRLYRNLEVVNQSNDRANAENKYLQEQNAEMSWTINPDRMGK